ncbi:MAG: cytochrome c biogenesis protein CcsA [Acidobacteriota bacterium]
MNARLLRGFLLATGTALFAVGCFLGLTWAPPERHMGDVSRILYVHMPIAVNTLVMLFFAFLCAVGSLWTGSKRWDARMTAFVEVGLVFSLPMLLSGMIWARPTWGIWWTWDVRLTTSLVAAVFYAGVLILRTAIDDPRRRATWSAVATIIGFVDVPLIYFCVRWWRSLHQVQSSPETVDSMMVIPLRLNLVAVFLLGLWMVSLRSEIEGLRAEAEEVPEPARIEPTVSTA